jgi:hypothetical protein
MAVQTLLRMGSCIADELSDEAPKCSLKMSEAANWCGLSGQDRTACRSVLVDRSSAPSGVCKKCVRWARNQPRIRTFTESHQGASCEGKSLNRLRNEVLQYQLMLAARIAFQACSFNHSDISPFRIKSLTVATERRKRELCKTSQCAEITYGDSRFPLFSSNREDLSKRKLRGVPPGEPVDAFRRRS